MRISGNDLLLAAFILPLRNILEIQIVYDKIEVRITILKYVVCYTFNNTCVLIFYPTLSYRKL